MPTVEEMEIELEAMRAKRNGVKSISVEDEITVSVSDKIGIQISDKLGEIVEAKSVTGNSISFRSSGLL